MTETPSPLSALLEGQYLIERELGRGGMGVVYLARDVRLDRLVAIKVLPPLLAESGDHRERFLREARTAAKLSHPNIVPVYRADEIAGHAFFVMGFVDGESLADRLRRLGALSPLETVRVLREAAWALAYAHARGVIHRDVKPENLMIEKASGRVVVTDFGIARDTRTSRLTLDGLVLGSVHYMSPEQIAGDDLDGRSDIYTLGVVGYQCLTGRLPFDAEKASAVIVQHAVEPAPPVRMAAPDVPAALALVIDRCLAKDPSARYPTGEALADALTEAVEESPRVDTETNPAVVSEEEARAIWQRAAELQAEAATRLQARYRAADTRPDQVRLTPSGGYRVRDVESAAKEAGIGPEFVALAMAERQDTRSVVAAQASPGDERRWSRMLGTELRTISAVTNVAGTPQEVLAAIGQLFAQFPYRLTLRDTVGGHPLDGGVLVFDVPQLKMGTSVGGQGLSMFSYRMTGIELRVLNVTVRPVAQGGTEVRCYGDLRPGLRANWKLSKGIAAVLGMLGGGIGGAAAVGAMGLGALAAGPALAVGGAFGAASLGWYRWLYRYSLRKATEELAELLGELGGHFRSQAVFGTPSAGPRRLNRGT